MHTVCLRPCSGLVPATTDIKARGAVLRPRLDPLSQQRTALLFQSSGRVCVRGRLHKLHLKRVYVHLTLYERQSVQQETECVLFRALWDSVPTLPPPNLCLTVETLCMMSCLEVKGLVLPRDWQD